MNKLKEQLYKEIDLKAALQSQGVSFRPEVFKNLDLGRTYQEQVHTLFEYDTDTHTDYDLPPYLILPSGIRVLFNANRKSPYSIEFDGKSFYLLHKGHEVTSLDFLKRPKYYGLKTSDGTEMKTVANYYTEDAIFVAYSNECSLKDKGKDCLFCNINATKDTYGEAQGINWKYPRQIGETVAAAYKEGARHLTISGGFIPERREVDYYLDVAESIKEYTGLNDFNGTACIGAPHDVNIIERYKEIGYSSLAINIEVWNPHFFRAYCPGKEEYCGGRDNWVKSLELAVDVFGRGKVRSNMVGGLETKQSTLEGIDYLSSRGVVAIAGGWIPNPGSALEGHKSPDPEWHVDLAKKTYALFRKVGFTYDEIYSAYANPNTLVHDMYKIEEELLPVFKKLQESDKQSVS